jgi:hypothetical protein
MKILLLATATNLPWVQSEVQRILRSGLSVVPLFGPISYTLLADEIANSNAEGFWVCGHMADDGLDLGGERLSASKLAPLLRGRVRLIVLNTCSSLTMAQTLQRETDAEIIATIRDVEDEAAFGWGARFAQALARTGDTALADEQARPSGDNSYIRLAGKRPSMMVDDSMMHEEYARILSELGELRRAVQGSQAYGLVGLTGQMEQLRRENGALRWWLAALSVITLLELIMLVFIVSRYVFV